MPNILEDIQDYVNDRGIAIVGDDSFQFSMPAKVSRGVLFRLPLTGVKIDHELRGYFTTQIQVIVRDADYKAGGERCETLTEALTMCHRRLQNFYVDYMRPQHEPIIYPRSESGYIEFSVNYDVRFYS